MGRIGKLAPALATDLGRPVRGSMSAHCLSPRAQKDRNWPPHPSVCANRRADFVILMAMGRVGYRQRQADECERRAAVAADMLQRQELLVSACEWRLFAGIPSSQAPALKLVYAAPSSGRSPGEPR